MTVEYGPQFTVAGMNGPVSNRRVVVVTGSSGGIGAAAARLLAQRGDRVVVVGRSPDRTRAVAAELGADGHVADFAHLGQVRDLAAGLERQYPRIDVLINNAGLIAARRRTVTADGHELTFQVNHLAPFLLTALLRGPLSAAGARVITTSSRAAWAVLSSRRPARQTQQIRQRLSEAHGEVFELAGERLAAFPSPRQLLSVPSFPGVPQDKIRRLHGVADAALAGTLDVGYLKALGPEQAMAELQQINGIGPFYSALVVIRGTGFTDVLPVQEPKALALTAQLYQLDAPPGPEEFARIAEPWRPFRTWAVVLIRAAAGRIPGQTEAQALTADGPGRRR